MKSLKNPYINYYRYLSEFMKVRLKPMTLIIGARCKDGIVLVGDRKVSGGMAEKYTDKIRMADPFNDAIFAAAGTETLFEEFLDQLPKNVIWRHYAIEERNKPLPDPLKMVYTLRDFKHDCVSLLKEMKGMYSEVSHEESLQVLLAIQDHTKNKAILYFLDLDNCFPAEVKEILPIGIGFLSLPFIKAWKPDMTMKQTARLCAFIIKYVESEALSDSIGTGEHEPQICLIPDDGPITEITGDDLKTLLDGINKRVKINTQILII